MANNRNQIPIDCGIWHRYSPALQVGKIALIQEVPRFGGLQDAIGQGREKSNEKSANSWFRRSVLGRDNRLRNESTLLQPVHAGPEQLLPSRHRLSASDDRDHAS
jgi:hypothetical protein